MDVVVVRPPGAEPGHTRVVAVVRAHEEWTRATTWDRHVSVPVRIASGVREHGVRRTACSRQVVPARACNGRGGEPTAQCQNVGCSRYAVRRHKRRRDLSLNGVYLVRSWPGDKTFV